MKKERISIVVFFYVTVHLLSTGCTDGNVNESSNTLDVQSLEEIYLDSIYYDSSNISTGPYREWIE
jgi:hypothetical protein